MRNLILVFLLLIFSIPSHSNQSNSKMQKLYQVLKVLLIDISKDSRYFDSANQSSIEKHIGQFVAIAHNIAPQNNGSLTDPSLSLLSQSLISEGELAYRSFHMGQTGFARGILRAVTGACMECHSRGDNEKDLKDLPFDTELNEFNTLEKAQFFLASRQFDRSIAEYLEIIKDLKPDKSNIWTWESALREGLTVLVRVKKDPNLSLEVMESILKNKDAPEYIKHDARIWKKTLIEWKKEPTPKLRTEASLFNEAQRLMKKAHTLKQYPMDHSADILYLRASGLLYELLKRFPKGTHTAKAFLLQGLCYQTLNPKHFENLHELFYEACIKASPHTELSQDCYKRLEQSVYLGFTGSSGTHLPNDVIQKLLDLWGISFVPKPILPQ